MKYRSRNDIMSQILEAAASGGAAKHKIMYTAYVSYSQMKEYMAVLIEKGMMEYIAEEGKYRTTEKGVKFLRTYDEMGQLITKHTVLQ
jgi:predicted transcriptional regulator